MKILIVDSNAEGQAKLAKRCEIFDLKERDRLNLSVHLSDEQNYLDRLLGMDVMILGPGVRDRARQIARGARSVCSDLHVIHFVTDSDYGSRAFRDALGSQIRKVLPVSATPMDLLQELVSIDEDLRRTGVARQGNLIVLLQPKGSLGVTTIAASLAEIADQQNRKTVLWDLDIETKDLSRSLMVKGSESHSATEWISGNRQTNRDTMRDMLFELTDNISVLPPPHTLSAGMDLVGHPESALLVVQLLDFLRHDFDNIIVDTAGRLGPVTGALIRAADHVTVVVDDSMIGLTGIDTFLSNILPLVQGDTTTLRFIRSGTSLDKKEMVNLFEEKHKIPEKAWDYPVVPFDSAAARWAGSGKTLFTLGKKATADALFEIGQRLELLGDSDQRSLQGTAEERRKKFKVLSRATESPSLMARLFNQVANS